MLGIPNLNPIFKDETAEVFLHDVNGDGSLLVLHADVIPGADRKRLRHYDEIIFEIDEALRGRGLDELEAWVVTDEEIHYAGFFGFTDYVGELTVNGQKCFPTVHRLRKKL